LVSLEFGIRQALGADVRWLRSMVIRQVMIWQALV
jgi:hypothetical protein